MRARSVIQACAWLGVPSLLTTGLAPAADREPAARAAYGAGARAYAEKRFVEAGQRFEEAASLVPNSVALYTAALAWERAGDAARSADDFARALALGGLSTLEATRASERLAALEKSLGAVRVAGPADMQVHLDDVERGAPVPVTLHGAGGPHTLVAVIGGEGGSTVEHHRVVLESGTTIDIDLLPTNTPGPAPVAVSATLRDARVDSPSNGPRFRPTVGFVLVGAGGAVEIGATILWAAAVGARDTYRRQPTESTYDHAHSLESWTNVALVAGGALAVAGVTCLLWPVDHAPSRGQSHARTTQRGAERGLSFALDVEPTSWRIVGTW